MHCSPFCAISNSTSRDFSSSIVKLLVGPQRRLRFAHKDVLTKIPFFEKMLKENRWPEGASKFPLVKLPEDDPAVFDHVLAYAYQGRASLRELRAHSITLAAEYELERAHLGIGTLQDAHQAEQMQVPRSQEMISFVDLYVMADKFNMEQCLEDIVDRYGEILRFQGVDCANFLQAMSSCPEICELRDMMITHMAYESRQEGYETYKHNKPELFSAFIEADLENALQYAKALCDLPSIGKRDQEPNSSGAETNRRIITYVLRWRMISRLIKFRRDVVANNQAR